MKEVDASRADAQDFCAKMDQAWDEEAVVAKQLAESRTDLLVSYVSDWTRGSR